MVRICNGIGLFFVSLIDETINDQNGTINAHKNKLLTYISDLKKINYLSSIAGILAMLGIIADLVTVFVFLRSVSSGNTPLTTNSLIPVAIVIFVMFLFSLGLYKFSHFANKGFDSLIMLFSWLYILLAALFFGVLSYHCIIDANYNIWQFLGYILLICFVTALGSIIGKTVVYDYYIGVSYFSVPFMVVGLEQAFLWTGTILYGFSLKFDSTFATNILLFAVAGLFIVYFIKYYNRDPKSSGRDALDDLIAMKEKVWKLFGR